MVWDEVWDVDFGGGEKMGRLTARGVSTAAAGKHSDGLILAVSPTGVKKWILRYQIAGRRRDLVLGHVHDLPLADAREESASLRALARKGTDPMDARKVTTEPLPTFTQAAARYIRAHRHGWSNPKHQRQWVSTLKTYARPVLGGHPVDQIATDDVLRVLQPIWTAKTETAKRVQGRMENILDWCAARQYRSTENPARWRGHLDKLLARPSRVKSSRHQPAMPYDQVPAFLQELGRLSSVSAMALRFLILTATRTSEVLQAQWGEIDTENAVWTIPPERMKARREHRVPLTDASLAVLDALPQVAGNPYLFPGARQGRSLSNMALLQVMRGMGYGAGAKRGDYVPHGFRSSFRDWAGEVSSFPRDVCEMALAHVIENKVEAAYRRGDLFAKRWAMMSDWAEFVTAPSLAIAKTTQS